MWTKEGNNTQYLDVSDLSDYGEEEERIYFGLTNCLLIVDIHATKVISNELKVSLTLNISNQ